jgi:hypothetical protein
MQQFLVLDDKNAGVANLVNFDQFQRIVLSLRFFQ